MIVYSKEKLMKYDLRISMSAVLVTDSNIPWSAIDLIYVVPSYKHGKAWVLYDPELIDCEIKGHTRPSHSGNDTVWGAKDRGSNVDIDDGLGTSPCGSQKCPNCGASNPNGFTLLPMLCEIHI